MLSHLPLETYRFVHPKKALAFQGHCFQAALKHMGVVVGTNVPKDAVEGMLAKEGVQIDVINKYEGKEFWKNGFYLKKNGELAYFVSEVLVDDSLTTLMAGVTGHVEKFHVITNAKV